MALFFVFDSNQSVNHSHLLHQFYLERNYIMSKNIFLFSGQGSQSVGMGIELSQRYPSTQAIFECANDILGFDMKHTLSQATAEELAQTNISQPAILTVSLIALEAMKQEQIPYQGVAGHSLGEYAAMIAAGIVSMEDGYRLIKHRAAAMQESALAHPGAMCAVMGADTEQIKAVCEQVDGYVVPVNYNSPAQTVIAGETQAVDAAIEQFGTLGKKCIKLAVSAAFHSKLMQPAADKFQSEIQDIAFGAPQVEFYSNVTGKLLTDTSNMPAYLASHLTSPVQFVEELHQTAAAGYENYIELGPNKVLTGLVKKTLKDVCAVNVENDKTLQKALEKLQ